MPSGRRLNLCVVGCGWAARIHSRVARAFRSEVGLCYASRSVERAVEYNRRFGGTGAFGSYEEACAAWDVDGVIVCTPPAFHAEQVELAARHRKAILLEKPAARTVGELDRIQRAVESAGVLCMVAENYYFKPLMRVLREHLERGDIGAPVLIEVNRAHRSQVTGWRADPDQMGGGALLEGGVHWVNLLANLGGTVREVIALQPRGTTPPAAPMEDTLLLATRFESGAVGKLLHSWNLPNRLRGVQLSKIYGEAGTILFESNGLFCWVSGRRTRLRLPGVVDLMGYRGMQRHFIECLRSGRPPAMSLGVARRDLEIVLAAYESLETGRVTAVGMSRTV